MQEKIHFFYTNDLHSDFTYWPKVASFMKNKRKNSKEKDISSFLFDIGDHMDRFNMIADAFKGKGNVQLLNDLSYDCITIGNNEGITLAEDELDHLYDEAMFDVVVSNMRKMNGQMPEWLQHSTVYETHQQTKIGVVGVTAPFNPFYHLLNWHIDEIIETLQWELDKLKNQVDIIVLLSHVGLNEDRRIASLFPEIDVIIGGHTHHILKHGEIVNNSILTAAGKHCSHVGEVLLTYDHTREEVIRKEASAINITHMEDDAETVHILQELQTEADLIMKQRVVTIPEDIHADPYKNSRFLDHFTHTLHEWTGSDCAMLNAGILIEPFHAGDITYKDIHQACPHPINPCVVEVSGRELLEVVRETYSEHLTHSTLTGFGFRGDVIGIFSYAGIDVKRDEQTQEDYIYTLSIQGQPLVEDKNYRLATVDMFTFGRMLPEIARSPYKKYFLPEMIRDVLTKALKTYV